MIKYENYCSTDSDCKTTKEMCAHSETHERGICIENPYLQLESKLGYAAQEPKHGMAVPAYTIPQEIISTIPRSYNSLDKTGICGNDPKGGVHVKEVISEKENAWYDCAAGSCDNPVERDKFDTQNATIVKLDWLVLLDIVTSDTARTKISVVHSELNTYFLGTGFQFESTIRYYDAGIYNTMDIGVLNCPANITNCINAMNLLTGLQGTQWQTKGAIQILYRPTNPSNINGYGMFPWYTSYHGLMIVNPRAAEAGATTVPHELGHVFGLWHTFHGISELSTCNTCYEATASDESGDFCSDTVPVARNWLCGDAPVSAYPDPCDTTRSTWGATGYTNLMSYSSCRRVFTAQQIRRMRCWFSKFVYKFTK